MRHCQVRGFRPIRCTPAAQRQAVTLGLVLAIILVMVWLTAAGCGEFTGPAATTGSIASTTAVEQPPPDPGMTDEGASGARPTTSWREDPMTTTSAPPPSVTALEQGITPEQVLELLVARSHIAPRDWELRSCINLRDWAVADVYTDVLAEWMGERGVAAVFEKKDGAWLQAGWVSLSYPPHQQMIELTNMDAPGHVWAYFGLDPASVVTGEVYAPEQMPDDFGFIAAYGVMGRNEIDTFAGTFTKDLGPQEHRVTTELRLPYDVLEGLYHDLVMIEIQWWVFSDGFAPDPDPENTGTSRFVQPYMTYRLDWSAGGFDARPVEWEDSFLSQATEAIALRCWFEKLQRIIEATPEWQALPPMTGGYL